MAKKKDRGWIKLHRKIQDNPVWLSPEPFDRRSAWIDLLLMANHEERVIILHNGKEQIVKAGQMFTSLDHLASRWHWSRNRVRRYLALISAQGMCTQSGTPSGTLLTVVKWGFFQGGWHTDGQADEQTNGQTDGQTDGQRTRTNIQELYNKNERRESCGRTEFLSADGQVIE